jgi:hypothetical protein
MFLYILTFDICTTITIFHNNPTIKDSARNYSKPCYEHTRMPFCDEVYCQFVMFSAAHLCPLPSSNVFLRQLHLTGLSFPYGKKLVRVSKALLF